MGGFGTVETAASGPAGAPPVRSLRDRLDDLSTPGGMLLVAALVVTGIAGHRGRSRPGFLVAPATGQLLIANHLQLLGNAPYTYTVSGHHWTMHEWLFEVRVAVLYNSGGLGAIVAALSLLTWLGIVAILLRARFHTRNRLALGMAVIVGVVAANPIWGPRDQMIDFTFSCALLLVVERHLRRGGRVLWLLPSPLSALDQPARRVRDGTHLPRADRRRRGGGAAPGSSRPGPTPALRPGWLTGPLPAGGDGQPQRTRASSSTPARRSGLARPAGAHPRVAVTRLPPAERCAASRSCW